jgi:hypothetical protein
MVMRSGQSEAGNVVGKTEFYSERIAGFFMRRADQHRALVLWIMIFPTIKLTPPAAWNH